MSTSGDRAAGVSADQGLVSGGDIVGVSAAFVAAVVADPAAMAQTIAGLNVAVHDEHGLARLLGRAARVAASWVPGADWAGLTIRFDDTTFTAGETDPVVKTVDQVQYDTGVGPCVQALRTGTVVSAGPQVAVAAWPEFTARAAAVGMRSFLAAPLIGDGRARGAINLYSRNDAAFDGHETQRLVVLADLVGRGLGEYVAVTDAHDHARNLQQALASRAPIEQAKGILMAVHRIDDDAAFALLSAQSQNTNTKLHDVATELVTRLTTPQEPTETAD